MFALLKSASNLASVSVLATAVAGGSALGPAREHARQQPEPAGATGWGGEPGAASSGDRHRARFDLGRGSIRIDFNDRFRHREIDVAPEALELEAIQTGCTVVVFARGHNLTSGFRTSLELDCTRGEPRVTLRNIAPRRGSVCGQALTAFECAGSFEARGRQRCITVYVDGCRHEVPVRQVEALRAGR